MNARRAREGDILETFDGAFFNVKGSVHPPNRAIAIPKFVPDEEGDRAKSGIKYKKLYSLHEGYSFLREKLSKYLAYDPIFDELLCEIPFSAVMHRYDPIEGLTRLRKSSSLDEVERSALSLAELLKEISDVPWDKIGISGSILIGLHSSSSDVDLIIYGSENGRKVYEALRAALKDKTSLIRPYDVKGLRNLFELRSKDTLTSFEDFVRVESRKVLQGEALGRDYFIRLVKDWNEVDEEYGSARYVNLGRATIKARVVNDSEAIFTPCNYGVENVEVLEGPKVWPILEIASFRGRFCEQARLGDIVRARGKIEKVVREGKEPYYRLLLGGERSDFMMPT